jgi:hypothetical protein
MIAKSKGNRFRALMIVAATSYWARSPVPESPMTRNFTDSLSFGSDGTGTPCALCADEGATRSGPPISAGPDAAGVRPEAGAGDNEVAPAIERVTRAVSSVRRTTFTSV